MVVFKDPKLEEEFLQLAVAGEAKVLKPWKGKSPSKDRKGKAVERRETFGETDLGLKH